MTGYDGWYGFTIYSKSFAGLSALGGIVSAIFACTTWRQALGSKEAKAKADEAHKAALAMSAAAERSAKAAEERADQAEKLLERMQQLIAEQHEPIPVAVQDCGQPTGF